MKTEANAANGMVNGEKTEMPAWHTADPEDLELTIEWFKTVLPGWWYSVCECEKSCDASCAPTRESPDIELIAVDKRFDEGFHIDLPQPAKLATALQYVLAQAQNARLIGWSNLASVRKYEQRQAEKDGQ